MAKSTKSHKSKSSKARAHAPASGVVHKCDECGKDFPGTGKRGRPHKRCPKCRAISS